MNPHEPPPLKPSLTPAQVSNIWSRVSAAPPAPSRATWPRAAVALAAVALVLWLVRPGPVALLPVGAQVQTLVTLADDSVITPEAGATLEVLRSTGAELAVLQRSGAVKYSVTEGGPRRWVVETALGAVEVLGTVFTVDVRSGALKVDVERGRVFVRGAGRAVTVSAGESVTVSPDERKPTEVTRSQGNDGAARADKPDVDQNPLAQSPERVATGTPDERQNPSTQSPERVVKATPDERQNPSAQSPERAEKATSDERQNPSTQSTERAVKATPNERRNASAQSPERAVKATPNEGQNPSADVRSDSGGAGPGQPSDVRTPAARLSAAALLGQTQALPPAAAAASLEKWLASGPRDADWSIVALRLGTLELDERDAPARALVWFDAVVSVGAPPSALEDASARRVDALLALGKDTEARAAAKAFRARWPSSSWGPTLPR